MQLDNIVQKYKHIFYFDTSWHLYRSFFAFADFNVSIKGFPQPTGHIYGVLRTIKQCLSLHTDTAVVLCIDGYPKRRKQIKPEYKSNRPSHTYNILKDVSLLIELALSIPNVYVAYHPDMEADDLMFALSQYWTRKDQTAWIYSGDDDLLQGIRDNIFVVRKMEKGKPIKIDRDFVVNDDRMRDKFRGCEPQNLPIYRAIVGDKSDELPGIPRFPRESAVRLSQYKTLDEALEKHDFTKEPSNLREKLTSNYNLIKTNDTIMRLRIIEELPLEVVEGIQLEGYSDMDPAYRMNLTRVLNLRSMFKECPPLNTVEDGKVLYIIRKYWEDKLCGNPTTN